MTDPRPVRPTDGTITLVEYRPEWPEEFAAERRRIRRPEITERIVLLRRTIGTMNPGGTVTP
jgi:hypothetical protein